MKTIAIAAISCLFLASPALAGGKGLADGLSNEEVAKLTKSLGGMQAKYQEVQPAMTKLKGSKEIRKDPKLTAAATDVLKSNTAVGVFLKEMETGLKKRDPKVNSYEVKLKGEIDTLELKLAALKEQAKASKVPAIVDLAAGAVVFASALDALYVTFDSYYDVAVADVDLLLLPVFDVYDVVHYDAPIMVIDHDDVVDVVDVVEVHDVD